jgi:hypothetical protein
LDLDRHLLAVAQPAPVHLGDGGRPDGVLGVEFPEPVPPRRPQAGHQYGLELRERPLVDVLVQVLEGVDDA